MKNKNTIIKYKRYIDENIMIYYTNNSVKKMKQDLANKDSFEKEYSRGGLCMVRGYYNPSLIEEIVTTNISRGNKVSTEALLRRSGISKI